MNERIVGNESPIDIEVKRFYIPGVKVEGECPVCGAKCTHNFGDDYFSYPTANGKPEAVTIYCRACDEAGRTIEEGEPHWTVKVVLKVSVEMAK